ncbi:MAG: OmpA family protein [Myxococcaceae bacterium]|nr:OmpA family protein [Myxococcaceae bacterium]
MRSLALLTFLPLAAFADAVDVSLTPKAQLGQGYPAVNVRILEPVVGIRLNLKRSDGKDVEVKSGGKVGQTKVLELFQPEGKFGYSGELTVNFANGSTSSMPLQFDAELWGPLHMKMKDGDIDVAGRKLTLTIDRPVSKVHLTVLMDTGRTAYDNDVPFNGEAAGTPLTLTWPEASGRVMKITVRPYDTAEFFTGVELYPWSIDIPHEEVNFDSGKFDIRPEEAPKLDASYKKIAEAVERYGHLAELKLYLAGHTDSVGPKDSNRTLSLNRAKSLGAFLRKKGLKIPLFYEGFGEEALLVATPDETDEIRNRRAEYIIAVEPPKVTGGSWVPKWNRL